LEELQNQGLIEARATSPREIADLLAVAERDISDAQVEGVSLDARFNSAYNAVRIVATAILRCHGYRTKGQGQHKTAFDALGCLSGPWDAERINYFDACRRQRNAAEYDRAGVASESQVKELLRRAKAFRKDVLDHLRRSFPQYLP
jgi:uncharacterized protein (UPF0332 family)